jgi:small-conductance mechanosensitive channel
MPDLVLTRTQLPLMDFAVSLLLVLLLVLGRVLGGHAIRRRTGAALHLRRRWTANLRNLLLLLGILGLALIWAPQLRTFALSLTAVAVAIVIATKELILCFSGSLMRASSSSFAIGDWIEVAGTRGEVVDHNLFVTVVHEFQPGTYSPTGRRAVLPNSLFLGQAMRNESLMHEHAFHAFSLTVDPTVDAFAHRTAIEAIVARHHAPLRATTAKASSSIERRFHVDLADRQMRVAFRTTDLGKYRIGVTVLCPTEVAESLENDITCDVMSYLHGVPAHRQPEPDTPGDGASDPPARPD